MKRALVLSLICVLGLAFSGLAATLSGSWDTDVTIDPTQTDFNDAITLLSVITVAYQVGDWTFTSVTDLTQNGWTDQDFSVAGVLGAFSISSALDFVPADAAFGSWNTTAAVAIAGVSFGADFTLADEDVELILSGSGVAGDVTVGVEVTFGGIARDGDGNIITGGNNGVCDLDWAGVTIDIGFPFCCAEIDLAVAFDCSGFSSAVFSTTGIVIPNLPWLTLDADVTFTLDDKVVSLTPGFDFGTIVCFTVDFAVANSQAENAPLVLGDISIVGIGLTCDIGAVTFTGYTDFAATEGDYFEWYTISTNDDACCGPFTFDLGFYFLDGGIRLFDIAMIEADMTLQVASQFSFNMGLDVDVEAGDFALWTVGFEVTW